MKSKYSSRLSRKSIMFAIFLLALISSCTQNYMKMNPPADSDKPLPVPAGDGSCWLHTASNMLAGAGYGNGTTVQARSDDIWADMSAHYRNADGTYTGGWPQTAVYWWLGSTNNTWTSNPYTLVTVYGSQATSAPWADANAPQTLGNEMRSCNLVGLGIRWATDATDSHGNDIVGSGGHAITLWGDNGPLTAILTANPTRLLVTDSDTDNGGNIQEYTYDAFASPNPGGPNEGNGWYFNAYGTNHPYISNAFVLKPGSGLNSVMVTGSYKIQQSLEQPATDLHYLVGTDVDVLTYRTWIDWPGNLTIAESQPLREFTVDWQFSKDVPKDTWVTINTEFVESSWNAIWYKNVHFTYPEGDFDKSPDLYWSMETKFIDNADKILNVVGGYVIGSFDVVNPEISREPIVHYRFVHQYLYNQNPEYHVFQLAGTPGFVITNLRFTHSYSYPTIEELWAIEKQWMTEGREEYVLGEQWIRIILDWKGRLPYPEGYPPTTDGNPEIK